MKVFIMGPNLHGAKTTFIVHADGCRDIRRDIARHGSVDHGFRDEVSSLKEMVNLVYDFVQDESEDGLDAWDAGHLSEFDVKPCVTVPDE